MKWTNVLIGVALFLVGVKVGALNGTIVKVPQIQVNEKIIEVPFWDCDRKTDLEKAEMVATFYGKTLQSKEDIDAYWAQRENANSKDKIENYRQGYTHGFRDGFNAEDAKAGR